MIDDRDGWWERDMMRERASKLTQPDNDEMGMYLHACMYVWMFENQPIGIMDRVFANGLGDWGSILSWVIPKTQNDSTWYPLVLHSAL